MSLPSPAMILVRPQMGENIGAAARAMMNFGLHDLRLVSPRDGWPNQAAIDMSSGALDLMPAPQIFNTLPESIADTHYIYATTARRRDMTKPAMDVRTAMEDAKQRRAQGQHIVFMFGPERTGLENEDLAHAHAIIHVPTNPDFSSLNLGQCVLLLAYEWMAAGEAPSDIFLDMGDSFPAPHKDLDAFFKRLENELDQGRFFKDDHLRANMMRNIRALFLRADLSDQELRTLHGIVSALIGNKTQ